jgi:tight adherence protein B
MDTLFNVFAVVLFAAVILVVEGAWLWWNDRYGGGADRIRQRLGVLAGQGAPSEQVSILKQRLYSHIPLLDRMLKRVEPARRIDRLLVQAGARWRVAQVLSMMVALPVVGIVLLSGLRAPPWILLLAAASSACLPLFALFRARAQRMRRVELQLPDAADFIARAMRAGHSFTNVLQMAGAEMPEPLGSELRAAHEEINYGVPLNEALHNLAARIPLTDLRYLVIAVLIQRESGGNLAEILSNISRLIRSRLQLLAQVRVLSAEGRMSAWVLGLLPFCVLAAITSSNPEYTSVLWNEPAGQRLLWYGVGMLFVGVLWLRRVIHIRI